MIDTIYRYNAMGWATFPIDAKTKEPPQYSDWATRTPDILRIEEERHLYERYGAYGIKLLPEDLVLDIDPRNFADGENPWKKLQKDLKLELQKPPAVSTGGGGLHLYYKKPADFLIGYKFKEYPGLDVLSGNANRYVVGPGSLHPNGKLYSFLRNCPPLEEVFSAPQELLELLKQPAMVLPEGTDGFIGGEQEYNRYVNYILRVAIKEKDERGGDPQRYRIACVARDYGLTPDMAHKAMLEHYNPVCDPVWSSERLLKCVYNAYNYAKGVIGREDPSLKFEAKPVGHAWDEEPDELRGYALTKSGDMKKTMKNAVNFMYIDPKVKSTMRSNQFTGDIEIVGKLPWHAKRGLSELWTDEDVTMLKYYIAKTKGVEFSTTVLWEALKTAAVRFAYHPVRDYINSLTWDGKSRLDTWLTDYCEVELNDYTKAVGRKILAGLVARVFAPGIKFDFCPIFEGDQGIGKSTICAILGGKWYADVIIDPHSRDTIDAIRGKWVVELSEMDVAKRTDAQALKAFISRTSDRTRLAYARVAQDFPRQCVFFGTVNPDEFGYLTDNTGNRRFWPVFCQGKIKIDELYKVRDQLFAEAFLAFKKKEMLYLTRDVLAYAELEQGNRVILDPWQDTFSRWLDSEEGREVTHMTTDQVWEYVLGGNPKDFTRAKQIRIGYILKRLGWWKHRPSRGGSRAYVYERPGGGTNMFGVLED